MVHTTISQEDFTAIIERGFDAAYAARVNEAVDAVMRKHEITEHNIAEAHGIAWERWEALSRSYRLTDREEFARFAGALEVEPRWLAQGSGTRERQA